MVGLQEEDGPCHFKGIFENEKQKQKQNASFMNFTSYSLPYSAYLYHQTAVWTVPKNKNGLNAILKEDIVFQHALPLFSVLR